MYLFIYGVLVQSPVKTLSYFSEIAAEKAWVYGDLYDTGKGFPAMTYGKGRVWGKLLKVEEEDLSVILHFARQHDELNPPYVFSKKPVKAYGEAETYDAHTFLYVTCKGLTPVPDDSWEAYLERNQMYL